MSRNVITWTQDVNMGKTITTKPYENISKNSKSKMAEKVNFSEILEIWKTQFWEKIFFLIFGKNIRSRTLKSVLNCFKTFELPQNIFWDLKSEKQKIFLKICFGPPNFQSWGGQISKKFCFHIFSEIWPPVTPKRLKFFFGKTFMFEETQKTKKWISCWNGSGLSRT